jgi:two-component system, OmpR family, response regulator
VLLSVILVDDDDDIRTIAEMSLTLVGGFTVMAASCGRTAIDLALRETPDVIVLDVMMPGMDGLNTLRQIRLHPQLAAVPVIFMTAKVQARDLAQYVRAGAIGVITKPFDAMNLPREVQHLLDDAACRPEPIESSVGPRVPPMSPD